jgi:NAD(P)-dependent dehydrogenase (short-subunit alcohol dehydrogenase family)
VDYDRWVEENVPDLTGKIAVVTGANGGLGAEASRVLARKGAQVILAVRDTAKGEATAYAIRQGTPAAQLRVLRLDLANLASVGQFSAEFGRSYDRLDILLNNAGVMGIPKRKTVDGFDMQFGTNHLGHFALTGLLLPFILAAPAGRVVSVSSAMHIAGKMDFDDLHGERKYNHWRGYAQSKLANLLFVYELQRKFAAYGCRAIALAAHPGYASTNLQAVGPTMTGSRIGAAMMAVGNRVLAQSAAMGALPLIYAATSPNGRGGEYYGPSALMGQRGWPMKARSTARSHDREAAARLWAVSEEQTRVTYDFSGCGDQ